MRIKGFKSNIAFGVLLAFVLVFGVQGICEALKLVAKSDTIQVKQPDDDPFEIEFTVTLVSDTGNPVEKGTTKGTAAAINKVAVPATDKVKGFEQDVGTLTITPDNASDYYYYDRTTADTDTEKGTTTRNWVERDDAYYYNKEAIGILLGGSPTSPDPIIVDGTSYRINPAPVTKVSLPEGGTILSKTSGSITLTLKWQHASPGEYTITISDETAATDKPLSDLDSGVTSVDTEDLVFTLHVTREELDATDKITAQNPNDSSDTTGLSFVQRETGKEVVAIRDHFIVSDDRDLEIRYRVVSGDGMLYAAETATTGTFIDPTEDLIVHQDVNVFLNTEQTTNRVVASIAGQDRSKSATILYEYTAPDRRDSDDDDSDDDDESVVATNTLSISLSGSGNTRTVTVNALRAGTISTSDIVVNLTATGGSVSPTSGGTSLTSTWTLPSAAGTYTVTATTSAGYSSDSESVTVTVPGTLTAVQEGQVIRVTAAPAPTSPLAFTLTRGGVWVGGGEIQQAPLGWGRASPVGITTGSHVLVVRADGYGSTEILFTPGATPATGQQQQQQQATSGTAEIIEIEGSRNLNGTLAESIQLRTQVLDANDRGVPDIGVTFRALSPGQGTFAGARGSGRAIRVETNTNGSARAIFTPTRATSRGTVTVEAKAAGVTQTVSFIIDVGEGTTPTGTSGTAGTARTYKAGEKIPLSTGSTLNFSGSRTVNGTTYTCVGPGECVVSHGLVAKGEIRSATTPTVQAKAYKVGEKIPISLNDTLTFTSSHTVEGTTYTCVGPGECVVSHGLVAKGEIRVATKTGDTPRTGVTPGNPVNAVVHVNAANRPPMFWVDGGAIYPLVGGANAKSLELSPVLTIKNAQYITVGGNKVYWTERTGESAGTINSANLDGSGVKELASIQAVPMGIAVDTAGSKLYWTNSRGRIQSANLDGSRITNELQNLEGVMDLALAGGNAYWTQGGNVRFVNLRGQKQIRNISTGTDTAGSLAIAGGKVYWTEKTGDSGGTVNSANLNGTGATQLASILAAPRGIAVDAARSKLYWTNSRGRIQSANLDGSKIQNVVSGLGSPGDMVISNSIQAPASTTTAPKTTTAANKYDVNGDGTVDSKDSDALTVALAAGVTDAKYDVNGDGKVDIHDLVAVNANRSSGAASAPALIGNIKLSAIQIDRLQEQIELLIATGDRSPAAMKTLIYLQQLIAMARPEKTQLFANYPNPFNPETWIPYELATDTNVRITIYNTQGVVIRTLQLGQQSAGYYTDRERAAYWDGRNALGEQVASGIYFYQFETDALSLMRKMVILK